MNKRDSLRGRLAERKRLNQVRPADASLGMPTIMDRTLASEYGVPYVHLAVFCIDMDRAYQLSEEWEDQAGLPFGWEVFLTTCYVATQLGSIGGEARQASQASQANDDIAAPRHALESPAHLMTRELLEAACLSVLDGDPNDAALGAQLTFAVHDGIGRHLVSSQLRPVFRSWRSGTSQLHRALDQLWAQPTASMQRVALHCLSLPLDPPYAPPTLELLDQMSRGQLSAALEAALEGTSSAAELDGTPGGG